MKRFILWFETHELLAVVLILTLGLLFFLSPAIFTWRYFAPADILRNIPPFVNGIKPHNYLLSDVLLQFLPWFSLSKSLLLHGQFPLWNPYSGGGLPLFANMQSAILFPLTWLFFFLPMKLALLLYSFGKLFFIGFFSYLYLRELKLSRLICLGGALGFMFAGFNVVWLLWPHTNVVFLLPLGCFLLERFFNSQKNIYLLYLALAVAIGVFAGHPETFFYICCFLGAYSLFKIFSSASVHLEKFYSLIKIAGAGLWGLLMAAVLLLPFIEYLKHSGILISRGAVENGYYLPKAAALLNAIPDFFGNPGLRHVYYGTFTNYNESAMGYVGIVLLFGACYSLIWNYRDKLVMFYGLALLFCLAIIYHVKFIFNLIVKLPGFSTGANHRLLLLVAFCLMTLGCMGLEFIYSQKSTKKIFLTLGLLWLGASVLFLINRAWAQGFVPGQKWPVIEIWQWAFYGIFVAILASLGYLLTHTQSIKVKYLLMILIFLETGFHGLFYNTATKNSDFYPNNPAINYLKQNTQADFGRVLFLQGLFPSNLGSWYGINQIADYDAVYLDSYQNLKARIGTFIGSPEGLNRIDNFSVLKLLATKFIVSPASSKLVLEPGQTLAYSDNQTTIIKLPAFPRAFFLEAKDLKEVNEKLQSFINKQEQLVIKPADNYSLRQNGNSSFSLKAPSDGYVIVSENFYPGWQAKLDGKKTAIDSVLGLKAIKTAAGSHSVELTYQPKSFYLGFGISLVALLSWLITLFILQKRQPRKN